MASFSESQVYITSTSQLLLPISITKNHAHKMKFSLLLLSAVYTATATTTATTTTTTTAKAATHVIFSYPGPSPPANLLSLISSGKVGGLILFGENIDANLPTTIANIQKTYASSPDYNGTPLLIMTDQEGGKVRRLPGGPTLSAKQVGQSSDPASTAADTGTEAATTLAKNGVNANLAPVLGVYRSAGDFLDEYGRSYGNTSELVASCADAFIRNQQGQKVIATAKHFPGLGAAGADANTDLEPVTIDLGLDELRRVDEAPYSAAIAAGVDMVMTSWAVYPALDEKPAGLSQKWIQGELRQRHGFKGVTITDAIEAGALGAYGDDAARGVLAAQAGMDLILASARNVTQGEAILDALTKALENEEVDTEEFDAGTARIMALRRTLHV
jgi:beta-glucosidase-like glycosyl hydrolase